VRAWWDKAVPSGILLSKFLLALDMALNCPARFAHLAFAGRGPRVASWQLDGLKLPNGTWHCFLVIGSRRRGVAMRAQWSDVSPAGTIFVWPFRAVVRHSPR
jgi:hypothetical protein